MILNSKMRWIKEKKVVTPDTPEKLQKRIDKISKRYIIEKIRNRTSQKDFQNNPIYYSLNRQSIDELIIILNTK